MAKISGYVYLNGVPIQGARVSVLDSDGRLIQIQDEFNSGLIYSIISYGDYIYTGDSAGRIRQYDKDLNYIRQNNTAYGGAIWDIKIDGNFIYAVGATTRRIRKYNLSDLTYTNEQSDTLYGSTLYRIDIVGGYGYISGATTNTIQKYDMTDLTLVAESVSYGGIIYAQVIHGDYIYIGGGTGRQIHRYNLSDLSYVDASTSASGDIRDMYVVGDFIYTTGASARIRRYNLSNLSYVTQNSVSLQTTQYCLDYDGTHFYVGGDLYLCCIVTKILESNLSIVDTSLDYYGSIMDIEVSDDYVYYGGNNRYRELLKCPKNNMKDICLTNADGYYEYNNIPANKIYHIFVEYTDGDQKYHSYSLPNVTAI